MIIRALKDGRWKIGHDKSCRVIVGDCVEVPRDVAEYLLRAGLAIHPSAATSAAKALSSAHAMKPTTVDSPSARAVPPASPESKVEVESETSVKKILGKMKKSRDE